MSEWGQKIFKWIVWSIIGILACIAVYRLAEPIIAPERYEKHRSISRVEWMQELSDCFGDEKILAEIENGELTVTGKYAAVSSMNAIGTRRLSYLTDEELNDEMKTDLAVEYGIIRKKQLDKEITREDADQILKNTMKVYGCPEYYPEYFEVEAKTDVIDADQWDISAYDPENQVMIAAIRGNIPEQGEVLMYTDEYGIAHAKHVDQINEAENGKYAVQVSDVADITELFDSISFSGAADFGNIAGSEKKTDAAEKTRKDPFITTVYAAEEEESTKMSLSQWVENKTALKKDKKAEDTEKCDIEFEVEIKGIDKNGAEKEEINTFLSLTSGGIKMTKKLTYDSNNELTIEESIEGEDGIKFGAGSPDEKDELEEIGYIKDEEGVKVNIKITQFEICSSGYYQLLNPLNQKNYIEVAAGAEKVELETTANFSAEDKYKIGTVKVPIASTGGVVCVDVNFYFVVGADGELSVTYEIEDPYAGVNVSVADGMKPLKVPSKVNSEVKAKIELNAGFIGEAAIMVFNWDLADPSADVRIYASAESVPLKPEYRLKEPYLGFECTELKVQVPVVKLSVSNGESLLADMLKEMKLEGSIELIKKDDESNSLLKHLRWHAELETDGTIRTEKMSDLQENEDVCTHIELKPKEEIEAEEVEDKIQGEIKDKINSEVDKKLDEAGEAIIEKIGKWLEEHLEDKCG